MACRYWLADALTETGCAPYAYVLMTNHVHLLLTPPSSAAVSRCIMALGQPDARITPHPLYQSLAVRSDVRLAR